MKCDNWITLAIDIHILYNTQHICIRFEEKEETGKTSEDFIDILSVEEEVTAPCLKLTFKPSS